MLPKVVFFLPFLGVGVLDGLLYAVGGHDGPLVRKSVECYNPETGQWVQIADMHLCRRNAGRKLLQESTIYTLLLFENFCFELFVRKFPQESIVFYFASVCCSFRFVCR